MKQVLAQQEPDLFVRKATTQPGDRKGFVSFRMFSDVLILLDIVVTVAVGVLVFLERDGFVTQFDRFAGSELIADQIYRYLSLTAIAGLAFGYLVMATRQFSFAKLTRPIHSVLADALGLWLVALGVVLGVLFLAKSSEDYSRSWFVLYFAGNMVAIVALRLLAPVALRKGMRDGWLRRRQIAIIGATSQAMCLLDDLKKAGVADLFDLVGIFDDRVPGERIGDTLQGVPIVGSVSELMARSTPGKMPVDIVAIAMPHSASQRILQLKADVQAVPAQIVLAPDLAYMMALPGRREVTLGETSLIKIGHYPFQDWSGLFKWLEDKLIASVTIFLCMPILLLIALAIRIDSPGPVFFRQLRFGFNNQPITVFKFRTMHQHLGDATGAQRTVVGDSRVTRVGAILRRLSLDELPQLFNVLLGNMSIVGPRAHPIKMKVLDRLYQDEVSSYAARHRVKPGITGLAQVNGLRGEVDTIDKAHRRVALDLHYIEHYSVWLDIVIIAKTFTAALWSKNAY